MNRRNFLSTLWAAVLAYLFPKRALAAPVLPETPDRIEIRKGEDGGFLVRSFYDNRGQKSGAGGTMMIVVTHHDAEVLVSGYLSDTPVPKTSWLQRLRYRWSPPGVRRCGRVEQRRIGRGALQSEIANAAARRIDLDVDWGRGPRSRVGGK